MQYVLIEEICFIEPILTYDSESRMMSNKQEQWIGATELRFYSMSLKIEWQTELVC